MATPNILIISESERDLLTTLVRDINTPLETALSQISKVNRSVFARTAIEMFEVNKKDLVIIDILYDKEILCPEIFRRIRKIDPDVPIIIATDYPELLPYEIEGYSEDNAACIPKFELWIKKLFDIVADALRKRNFDIAPETIKRTISELRRRKNDILPRYSFTNSKEIMFQHFQRFPALQWKLVANGIVSFKGIVEIMRGELKGILAKRNLDEEGIYLCKKRLSEVDRFEASFAGHSNDNFDKIFAGIKLIEMGAVSPKSAIESIRKDLQCIREEIYLTEEAKQKYAELLNYFDRLDTSASQISPPGFSQN